MPANRKPTALLEASGAYERNPARARPDEPNTGRGVGPAPDYLSEDQRKAWDSIVSDCAPGVWQSSDRAMLEGLCVLVAKFREAPDKFSARQYERLCWMLARCGMTPSDRSRVTVPRGTQGKQKAGLASFR